MTQPAPHYPAPHVIHPTQPHTHTIILLHGTSTSGPEFGDPFLSFPFQYPSTSTKISQTLPSLFPTIKWVFPSGTLRHVTVLNHTLRHAWFDLHSFSDRTLGETDQILGLHQSIIFLSGLIAEEVAALDSLGAGGNGKEKLIVGGFSQGAAMTAFFLLSGQLRKLGIDGIGGFVCLSGWLPFRVQIQEILSRPPASGAVEVVVSSSKDKSRDVIEYVRRLVGLDVLELLDGKGRGENYDNANDKGKSYLKEKVWMANGNLDKKVLLKWGKDVREVLEGVGCQVEMEVYEVEHAWNEEMMQGLVKWVVSLWGVEVLVSEVIVE